MNLSIVHLFCTLSIWRWPINRKGSKSLLKGPYDLFKTCMQSVVGLPLWKDVSLSTDAVARSKRSQRTIKISASPIKPTFLRCSDVSPAMRNVWFKKKVGTYYKVSVFFSHGQGFFCSNATSRFHLHHPAIRHGLYNLPGRKKYSCLHRVKTTVVDPQFKLLLQVHHSNIEMKAPQVLALDGGMEIHTCTRCEWLS